MCVAGRLSACLERLFMDFVSSADIDFEFDEL
jgi:hypothetical protein